MCAGKDGGSEPCGWTRPESGTQEKELNAKQILLLESRTKGIQTNFGFSQNIVHHQKLSATT